MELQDTKQKLDFSSLQMQYQFVDLFGEEKNCGALKKTFEEGIKNLEEARKKLETYSEESTLNKNEFDLLRREYTLTQINFWLLTKKTKDVCDLEYSIIFYFYADKEDCSKCEDQAVVLTYLKNKLDTALLNFAFDSELDEPLITILKKTYNLKTYPTLIINGEKFEGFVSKDEILKEICPTYKKTKIGLCPNQKIVILS